MTTETLKFRSAKQAQATADERGLTAEQYTITKVATANYVLTITIADEPALAVAEKPARAPKPVRVNRHYNDDSSLTLYVAGVKVRRLGGDDNEDASEEELEDVDSFSEKYLGRKYPKSKGGWVWGRTTQGHNWHTKRVKKLRAEMAELHEREATPENVARMVELAAQLARLTGKGA